MSHPFFRADAPLTRNVEILVFINHLGDAIELRVTVLAVMNRDASGINQIAVGDFVVTGGNLRAVGSDDAVLFGRSGDRVRLIDRVDRHSGGKGKAIAPGRVQIPQLIDLGAGLLEEVAGPIETFRRGAGFVTQVLTDVGKKTADLVEVKHDGRSNGGSLPRSQPRSQLARS